MRTEIEKKTENNRVLQLVRQIKEEEKRNDRWRQSDRNMLSHATPYGRGQRGTSKETTECQVWPLGAVTRTT